MSPATAIDVLRTTPGFSALDQDELARLADRASLARWEDGEAILRNGAPSDSMHVLVSGAARVPLGGDGDAARSVRLEAGAVFGEIGMLSGDPRTADVFAIGPCSSLVLRRDDVEPLLWDHPRLARLLTSLVRQRLQRSGDLNRVGKYRLLRQIGKGASSDVFEGLHEGLGRIVALKMLSHTMAYDRPLQARFVNEARIIASLEHPNIVRVYDTEAAYATHFIVMERLQGSDLRGLLAERGRLTAQEVAPLLGQAAAALAFAHGQGVVHGDVKPANCGVGTTGQLKLMDFGLATRVDGAGSAGGGDLIVGTPRYMAPELVTGARADSRSDVYALGVMGFELLAGRPPFEGTVPDEVMHAHVHASPPDVADDVAGVPVGLADFVRAALSKDPRERPDLQRAAELLGPQTPVALESAGARCRTTVHLDHAAEDREVIDSLLAALERGADGLATVEILRSGAARGAEPAPDANVAHVPPTVRLVRR